MPINTLNLFWPILGQRKNSLVVFLANIISNGLLQAIRNNIVAKKITKLVHLFHKDITKLVFLWSNKGQKRFKVLNVNFKMKLCLNLPLICIQYIVVVYVERYVIYIFCVDIQHHFWMLILNYVKFKIKKINLLIKIYSDMFVSHLFIHLKPKRKILFNNFYLWF